MSQVNKAVVAKGEKKVVKHKDARSEAREKRKFQYNGCEYDEIYDEEWQILNRAR